MLVLADEAFFAASWVLETVVALDQTSAFTTGAWGPNVLGSLSFEYER